MQSPSTFSNPLLNSGTSRGYSWTELPVMRECLVRWCFPWESWHSNGGCSGFCIGAKSFSNYETEPRSSKFQDPSSREDPSTKVQNQRTNRMKSFRGGTKFEVPKDHASRLAPTPRPLDLGSWCFSGSWILDFGSSVWLLLLGVSLLLPPQTVLAQATAAASPYKVRDFGAQGDGTALDTAALQKAIDACAAGGGGTVYFTPGTYLSGGLRLKSGVYLYLDAGATLKGSRNNADYEKTEVLGFKNDADSETSFFHFSLIW